MATVKPTVSLGYVCIGLNVRSTAQVVEALEIHTGSSQETRSVTAIDGLQFLDIWSFWNVKWTPHVYSWIQIRVVDVETHHYMVLVQ